MTSSLYQLSVPFKFFNIVTSLNLQTSKSVGITEIYQATGYVTQHTSCLTQARINWEVAAGRASGIKMGGMMLMETMMIQMGWQPAQGSL